MMTTMRFRIDLGEASVQDSSLVYRPHEYSFDTVSSQRGGVTSVLLNDLNLEMDNSNRVIAIWGMCPHTRWVERALVPPMAQSGSLIVSSEEPFLPGVSVRMNGEKRFPVYVDRKVGWIQVKGTLRPSVAVMLLPGVIFEMTECGQFCSLWLMPKLDDVRQRKRAPSGPV